jgi:hypothetical protein
LERLLGSENHSRRPVRPRISPPKRIYGLRGPGFWLIVPHSVGPGQRCGEREAKTMPFVLLALVLVLAVVVLLLSVSFLVRRWL